MKTMKSFVAAGLAALLATGCSTTFKPWKLSEVQEGMSRSEVIAVLGEPDYTVEKDGAEYLYYTYAEEPRDSGYELVTHDDMQRKAKALSRSFDETEYEVVVVEGKLINYKEL